MIITVHPAENGYIWQLLSYATLTKGHRMWQIS